MVFSRKTSLNTSGESGMQTVAVAGGDDEAVLGVVDAAGGIGIRFILVGDADDIRHRALESSVDLRRHQIVPAGKSSSPEVDICRTTTGFCSRGEADVLMKGHVSTAAFTRAILDKESGLTDRGTLLSHIGFFADPRSADRRSFLLSDAAINISPDLEAKKKILANAVFVARALGCSVPRIALLAPVEKIVSRIDSTIHAAALKEWIEGGGLGEAVADGPFALDVAASAEAASLKNLDSPVSGKADIYLVPNLDAGNILYKALTVFAGASAAGVLAGARVPVVLTSRSDSMEVKLASLGLALQVAVGAGAGER